MRPCRNYLLAAGLLGLMLVLPCRSMAAPAQTVHFRLKGLTASAFFDSSEGCVQTSASVQATSNRIKMTGRPETTPSAFVSLFQFDNCSFTVLLSAFGSADLPAGALEINRNLSAATLNTSVDVLDFVSNTAFPVDISLNWSGTGPLTVSRTHNIVRAPGFRENFTVSGASRPATASGSVSALGMNFSPNPASFAELDLVKEGDLQVVH